MGAGVDLLGFGVSRKSKAIHVREERPLLNRIGAKAGLVAKKQNLGGDAADRGDFGGDEARVDANDTLFEGSGDAPDAGDYA